MSAELTYKGLTEEILEANIRELKLHPSDWLAVKERIEEFGPVVPYSDELGIFLQFHDCKLRADKNVICRGWS